MFKHSFIILRNALIVSTIWFIFSLAWGALASEDYCFGMDCQEIACPDGYMIKVQPGKYVPCEELEAYLENQ